MGPVSSGLWVSGFYPASAPQALICFPLSDPLAELWG